MTVYKIGSKAREKLIVTKKYLDSIPKPVVDTTELRLRSIEQTLNLILKKLDNGNNNNGNNISSISK